MQNIQKIFYQGFAVILLIVFLLFLMLGDQDWFILVIIPLVCVAVYDYFQTKHSILRNFPILGHLRFILEFFGPEIHQYFIEGPTDGKPFDRDTRSIIYMRAKNAPDTQPFGTRKDIFANGYQWALHSLHPVATAEVVTTISIGGKDCSQPYHASRLNISAMSFGALSSHAIRALNAGAKIGGFAHNTGEGSVSEHHLKEGGDLIWQIGTAYFGCRDQSGNFSPSTFEKVAKLEVVKMIEIKLSQGAKPSEGGILPKEKITPEIAKTRGVDGHHDVLSPAAHSAFSTPVELCEFIQELRTLSGGKPVGFKLCVGKKEDFLGICKAMVDTGILPDFITVDGAEGGTGAAPMEHSNYVGTPLNEGLLFVVHALLGVNLKDKIKIICSGKIATGFDLVVRMAMGADLCNSARAMMMALGCVQSLQCNQNTCPTGITTQDKGLMRGLVVEDKKQRVANYHQNTIRHFTEIMASMGTKNPDELTPSNIMRRIDSHTVKSLEEVYPTPQAGFLLSGGDLGAWQGVWERASKDNF